jgi:hypothetical protein
MHKINSLFQDNFNNSDWVDVFFQIKFLNKIEVNRLHFVASFYVKETLKVSKCAYGNTIFTLRAFLERVAEKLELDIEDPDGSKAEALRKEKEIERQKYLEENEEDDDFDVYGDLDEVQAPPEYAVKDWS